MTKANFQIVATFVGGEWECNQGNFKCIVIMFYFLSLVVGMSCGMLELDHNSSQEPNVNISGIFQAGC